MNADFLSELTGEFNGPIAGLVEIGHVTSQTPATSSTRNSRDGRCDA
jgi:hypothetical protein